MRGCGQVVWLRRRSEPKDSASAFARNPCWSRRRNRASGVFVYVRVRYGPSTRLAAPSIFCGSVPLYVLNWIFFHWPTGLQSQQQIASLLPSSASAARLTRTSIFDLSLAFSSLTARGCCPEDSSVAPGYAICPLITLRPRWNAEVEAKWLVFVTVSLLSTCPSFCYAPRAPYRPA